MIEFLRIALRSMRHRKVRAWLTMLGIFIGIAGVVSLVALGNGLQDAVQKETEKLGFNRIMIQPAGAAFGPLSGGISNVKLTQKDIRAARKAAGAQYVGGLIARNGNIKYKAQTDSVNIFFHDTDRETLDALDGANLFTIEKGRDIRKGDRQKVVLGWEVAHEFFDKEIDTGNEIEIFGARFEVVGIQKKTGAPPYDHGIRIPLTGAEHFIDFSDEFTLIIAIAHPKANVEEVAANIKKKLRSSRDVDEGEEDFSVQTAKQLIDTVFAIFAIIQTVIVGIAGISLIVGAIGITNTMYTAVIERTKEIGVMKAIGAKNSDIAMIFLLESGMLGLAGGIIGILVGLGIAEVIAIGARAALGSELFQVYVSTSFMIGMLLFAFILGSLAGTLPAIHASKLAPVDALRHE